MNGGFRHQAFFYANDGEFIEGTLSFVREGVANGEPVLVALSEVKINRLRRELDGDARRVRFLDMDAFGRNPARIIAVWREFVARHDGAPALRGIGEPVWPGRSEAELAECDRHESLLNLAFAEAGCWEFTLLCPYDTSALDEEALAAARRNHPQVVTAKGSEQSRDYLPPARAPDPFAGALPPPPADADRLLFGDSELSNVRRLVWARAASAGLDPGRQGDLVTAINELASNSIAHGGGGGALTVWSESGALVCQVEDSGRFRDRLAGRRQPGSDQLAGRGLWLVNQFCDLVQIRSGPGGSVVRTRSEIS